MAEQWQIQGDSLAACNCRVSPCPCTTGGGNPTEEECYGISVFSIASGNYGDTDLSGVKLALFTNFAGFVFDGNWRAGLVVDEQADDRQFEAIQTILSGQAGGPFADLAGLIGEFLGAERGRISYQTSDGAESGSASVDGSQFSYTPLKTADGRRTKVINAALAFKEELFPGKSEGGRIDSLGLSADMSYADWQEFDLSGP